MQHFHLPSAATVASVEVRSTLLGLHDCQRAAVKLESVHGLLGLVGILLVVETDEGESSGLVGLSVAGNVNISDITILAKSIAEGLVSGIKQEGTAGIRSSDLGITLNRKSLTLR